MANFSSVPLAGAFNPNAGFYQLFGSGPDRYAELRKKYPSPAFDTSKSNTDVVALAQLLRADPQMALLQAELGEMAAQRASELSRQNIDYAVGQQRKYEKERDLERFKYGMLAGIPETISRSFGNIASTNLAGAQAVANTFANTLANYPQPQFSQYQFQPQKYFS